MSSLLESPSGSSRRAAVPQGFGVVAAMAVLMWLVEAVDLVAGDLDANGIRPREGEGLIGIVTSPFLHDGLLHLIGNTLPFLALGAIIALGGAARVLTVTAIVAVVGGIGVWLTAAAGAVVVGASGVVFGYAAYLLVRGLFSRRPVHLLLGLAVVAIYGTTLVFGLVPTPGVSWEGHLFGALGGVVAARVLDARREPRIFARHA